MINFFIYQPCKINKTKANNKKNQLKVNITVPPLPLYFHINRKAQERLTSHIKNITESGPLLTSSFFTFSRRLASSASVS